ncbi:MAG: hypothetical protein A2X12_06355 [Bacteroidetes bacterium GWE2_29_8]|nr:MAG: hypothetical protein A2X12_06355 [Bacteroidetes bacterium GWE2_29_8]OFY15660.1 MAG: hypothetical protein A2X02_06505 [Bacteroidetes bacterium GWF2_29_10]
MKALKIFIITLLVISFGNGLYAQKQNNSKNVTTIKTEKIKVYGNCGSCKTRIEKAAKMKGVSKADWDIKTNMLTLVYDTLMVKKEDVEKKIASVGHDTEKFKADSKKYEALPECCKYRK